MGNSEKKENKNMATIDVQQKANDLYRDYFAKESKNAALLTISLVFQSKKDKEDFVAGTKKIHFDSGLVDSRQKTKPGFVINRYLSDLLSKSDTKYSEGFLEWPIIRAKADEYRSEVAERESKAEEELSRILESISSMESLLNLLKTVGISDDREEVIQARESLTKSESVRDELLEIIKKREEKKKKVTTPTETTPTETEEENEEENEENEEEENEVDSL